MVLLRAPIQIWQASAGGLPKLMALTMNYALRPLSSETFAAFAGSVVSGARSAVRSMSVIRPYS